MYMSTFLAANPLGLLWAQLIYAKRYLAFRAFCYLAPRTFKVLVSPPAFGWSAWDRVWKAVVVNITNAVASAMANAFTTALDAGSAGIITIYTGTIPTDADTAIGAQTLLATLTFSGTSFGAASNGVITANAITSDSSADATGTAAWARLLTQGAGTAICDVSVGTATSTIIFNTVAFTAGSVIAISAFTFTHPKS